MTLSEHICKNGEVVLYAGTPNLAMLETLAGGPGDIWHSSFEQGFKNAFPEIAYQTATFFWYVRDFNLENCVSWRINPYQFAVRKQVWELFGGFDKSYENPMMQAFHFGFNALRYQGAATFYVKGLFAETQNQYTGITAKDRYVFFRKNFNPQHSVFM